MQNDNDLNELMQIKAEAEALLSRVGNMIARRNAMAQQQARIPVQQPYMQMPPPHQPPVVAPSAYAIPQYQQPPQAQAFSHQPAYHMPVQPAMQQPAYVPQPAIPAPIAPPRPPPAPAAAPSYSRPAAPATPVAPAASAMSGAPVPEDFPPVVIAMINIMRRVGRIMTFEQVYEKLQAERAPMPSDKPMLIIRRHLFNKAYFNAEKDKYWPAMDPHP